MNEAQMAALRRAQQAAAIQRAQGKTTQAAPQERGFLHRLGDNFIGYDDGVMSAGEQIAAALNSGGESMTFGLVGDEAAGQADRLIGRGDRTEFYRNQQEQLRQENPALGYGSEIAGAVVAPAATIPRVGAGALGLLGRMGIGAALGGAGGATHGFMEGEGAPQDRIADARSAGLLGGAIGAAVPVAGAALSRGAEAYRANRAVRRAARNAPDTEALRREGNALYRQIDQAGVQIKPAAFDRLRGDLQTGARARGLDELPGNPNTPRSARNLQRADEMAAQMAADPTAALPFDSLDQYRRSLNPAAADRANPTESAIGSGMRETLDDFVSALDAADLTQGDAQQLQSLIPRAREVWGRMRRSQTLDDVAENAQGYLGGETSGVRNQLGTILRNPRLRNQFSDEEVKLLRRVVNGSFPERMLRLLGNGLGSQGAVGIGAGAGTMMGGLPGGLLGGVIGYGAANVAHRGSEALARRGIGQAQAAVASGALRGQSNPTLTPAVRGLLDEALMRAGRGYLMSGQ